MALFRGGRVVFVIREISGFLIEIRHPRAREKGFLRLVFAVFLVIERVLSRVRIEPRIYRSGAAERSVRASDNPERDEGSRIEIRESKGSVRRIGVKRGSADRCRRRSGSDTERERKEACRSGRGSADEFQAHVMGFEGLCSPVRYSMTRYTGFAPSSSVCPGWSCS